MIYPSGLSSGLIMCANGTNGFNASLANDTTNTTDANYTNTNTTRRRLLDDVKQADDVAETHAMVGRCKLSVSKPELKARLVSA